MALGLQPHTKNMFRKFAESISPSRDWAGYWEINRYDQPAPVDYLNDPVFLDFYRHSLTDSVQAWDPDNDGFMESPPENGIRGIPTYWEGEGPRAITGADLVAAQFAANLAFSMILALRGELGEAETFAVTAKRLEEIYNRDWWNPETQRFNTAILPDGTFDTSPLPLGQLYPLFFGIVRDGPRRRAMVEELPNGEMVELNAYFPEILYRNGDYQGAFQSLLVQLDPALSRREYPEVSYTAVGYIVSFLMGVRSLASQGVVETKSRLSEEIRWAEVSNVPITGNEISVKHIGGAETHLRNETGEALIWRAVFDGEHLGGYVNGRPLASSHRRADGEGVESFLEVTVAPGEEVVVSVGERG